MFLLVIYAFVAVVPIPRPRQAVKPLRLPTTTI
jgi:hypothetical protein